MVLREAPQTKRNGGQAMSAHIPLAMTLAHGQYEQANDLAQRAEGTWAEIHQACAEAWLLVVQLLEEADRS
jgi:hypothetical protein